MLGTTHNPKASTAIVAGSMPNCMLHSQGGRLSLRCGTPCTALALQCISPASRTCRRAGRLRMALFVGRTKACSPHGSRERVWGAREV